VSHSNAVKRSKKVTYPFIQKNAWGTVKIYKNEFRGLPDYIVSYVTGSGRKREKFRDEIAAHVRAEEILDDLKKATPLRTQITSRKALEISQLTEILAEHGATLEDAVKVFLAQQEQKSAKQIMASKAVGEYLATFEKPDDDPHYKTARSILSQFGRAFGKTLDAITVSELDQYLRGVSDSGRTRNNHLNYLRTFFGWAQKFRGYLKEGPLKINDIKKYQQKASDPSSALMPPEDLEKLLRAVPNDIMPAIAIGAFAGVRNAEIGRLNWEDIRMDEKVIELSPRITKTQRRRMAVMTDNLIEWLQGYTGDKKGPILPFPKGLFKKRTRAAKAAGIKCPGNTLRKSYISYRMAICKNAAEVAEQCGNSVSMVQVNYKGLVTVTTAERWFSIFPNRVKFELLSKAA
jgi:integrase